MPESNRQNLKTAPGLLLATAFLSGGLVMALEIVGARMLAPTFGNSVFVWGSLISVFMGALAIGYFWGGRLASRYGSANGGAGSIALAQRIGWALLGAALWGFMLAGLHRNLAEAVFFLTEGLGLALRWGALLAATVIFGPPGVLYGIVSPSVVGLLVQTVGESGSMAGRVYGVSTVGSIVGTLLTTFGLIPLLGTQMILVSVAVATTALALALLLVAGRRS